MWEGKELVVLCVYNFRGKQKHLARLIAVFAKSNNFEPAFLKAARLYTVYVPCGNDS